MLLRGDMAKMPRGEPRSVPDPAGDLYDEWVRRKRAQEQASLSGPGAQRFGSPARLEAQDAMTIGQLSPDALDFIPVIGPSIRAVEDARAGRPLNAAGDVANAVLDLGLADTGLDVAEAGAKGVLNNVGRRTADAARKQLRRRGVAGPGQEIHHSFALNGMSRNVENWRNHPAFLKVLPKASHRRLTGSWEGKPRYDPLRRVWVGAPTWMKTVPAWVFGRALPGMAHLSAQDADSQQPWLPAPVGQRRALPPPAPYGERPLR